MKIGELQWDDVNIEHIGEHGINPSEVEDVCFGKHLAFPGRYGRYLIYGKTYQGKYIFIVLEHLFAIMFRPKTSRLMTDREKKKYRKRFQQGGYDE